jgi:hypothetical protein
MKNLFRVAALMILSFPQVALARDVSAGLKSFAAINVKPWLDEPLIVEAIRAQNAVTSGFDQSKIDTLDGVWREAVKTGGDNTVAAVVTGPLPDFLRGKHKSSGGNIVEIIVMDARGLNVAATKPPSDYWQGDEPKFLNSFGAGKDGVDVGAVEYDDSSGDYIAQLSLPVADPDTGELIGAVTVGIAVSALN